MEPSGVTDVFTESIAASALHTTGTPQVHIANLTVLRDIFVANTSPSTLVAPPLAPNPAATRTHLLQDEISRAEMMQAMHKLKVSGDIIISPVGTQKIGTHPSLHVHLRARSVRQAQIKRACTSEVVLMRESDDEMMSSSAAHDSDDDIEEAEEPYGEPRDVHVEVAGNTSQPETAHSAAQRAVSEWARETSHQGGSPLANNICNEAMLASQAEIHQSQLPWAKVWLREMRASMRARAETREGFWAALAIMRKEAVEVKKQVTRGEYEKQIWIGPIHAWRHGQEEVYNAVYKESPLLARVYKTACWAGYRHVPVMSLPDLDVFT